MERITLINKNAFSDVYSFFTQASCTHSAEPTAIPPTPHKPKIPIPIQIIIPILPMSLLLLIIIEIIILIILLLLLIIMKYYYYYQYYFY